jgi:aspartate racemase
MPHVTPSLPDVQWPSDEGVIGVVGVAPWATVDFLSQIYSQVAAQKDWHFPRVLVDANSKIPSRGRYFDLGETDPSPFIADTIDELLDSGATAVVVPCNTAHILADRWSARAKDKVVSIIEATLSEVPRGTTKPAVVLGSAHLIRHRTYLDPLEAIGISCHEVSSEQQALVARVITEIKVANTLTETTSSDLRTLLSDMQDADIGTIILGCTELSQALRCLGNHLFSGEIVDSNVALAKGALRRISGKILSHSHF